MPTDIHAHAVPESFLAALANREAAKRFPSVRMGRVAAGVTLTFGTGKPTRPIAPKLRTVEDRLSWLRECGIDKQIVSGWLDVYGYQLPPQEGAQWSRLFNEHLLAMTSQSEKLIPLATVPLQDGELASMVLTEAMQSGFPGAMIGTQPFGTSGTLDDPGLDEFWETAAELGAVIYIHPMFPCGETRISDYGLLNAVGRITDSSVAVSRLIYSGHLLRYPTIKFVVSHGCAALPLLYGRLKRNFTISPKLADPEQSMRQLYGDSVIFDPDALEFVVRKLGPGRIMLGSDYPFPIGDPDPLTVVRTSSLSDEEKASIADRTASVVFGIDRTANG